MHGLPATKKKRKARAKKKHQLTERNYLTAVTRAIATTDVAAVVEALLKDAKGGDGIDPKKVSLELLVSPEVIQGKR